MKSFIDLSRPMALYLGTLGILMIATLALNNAPQLALSNYLDIPYQRYWSAGLFLSGAILQATMFWLHGVRAAQPWKVARAHVTILYLLSTVLLAAAVAISK